MGFFFNLEGYILETLLLLKMYRLDFRFSGNNHGKHRVQKTQWYKVYVNSLSSFTKIFAIWNLEDYIFWNFVTTEK